MCRKYVSASAIAILFSVVSFNAQALPAAPSSSEYGPSDVTLIAGGCGIGLHRGPYGGCRVNGVGAAVVVAPAAPVVVVAPRACPLGFHLGPYRRHCLPN
jgi:hypothetical protein